MSLFIDLIGELLGCGHSVRVRTRGMSMYPAIKYWEKIVVEPVVPSAVKVGDVLLYRAQRCLIAHRVVRIARTAQREPTHEPSILHSQFSALSPHYVFTLRGDVSESSCDAPVEASQVLGRVMRVQRGGRTIDLESCLPKRVSAVRLCAARLRWAISSRLSGVISLLKSGDFHHSERRWRRPSDRVPIS